MATYDVFISYPHALQERVRPIKHALERAGARVWFDENEVDNFESITLVLDRGIRHSKVLLAFFESEYYPKSRACQWELTTAFIAAQNQGDPRDRVLVVNPSLGADHIQPGELRDALFPQAPESTDETGTGLRMENLSFQMPNLSQLPFKSDTSGLQKAQNHRILTRPQEHHAFLDQLGLSGLGEQCAGKCQCCLWCIWGYPASGATPLVRIPRVRFEPVRRAHSTDVGA